MKAGARAMSQGDEAKNAENMAECLARNDYAGDPCGHGPGLALDDATVDVEKAVLAALQSIAYAEIKETEKLVNPQLHPPRPDVGM